MDDFGFGHFDGGSQCAAEAHGYVGNVYQNKVCGEAEQGIWDVFLIPDLPG
jgi:hypothetical protein